MGKVKIKLLHADMFDAQLWRGNKTIVKRPSAVSVSKTKAWGALALAFYFRETFRLQKAACISKQIQVLTLTISGYLDIKDVLYCCNFADLTSLWKVQANLIC